MSVFSSIFFHISLWDFFNLFYSFLSYVLQFSAILSYAILENTDGLQCAFSYWRKCVVLKHRQRSFPIRNAKLNANSFMPSSSLIFLLFFSASKGTSYRTGYRGSTWSTDNALSSCVTWKFILADKAVGTWMLQFVFIASLFTLFIGWHCSLFYL